MKSMMKKTTVREIKHSFGRYFAILAIVMLGVGFFAGLKVTRTEMIRTADEYLTEHDFFDYRLLTTMGLDTSAPEEFMTVYRQVLSDDGAETGETIQSVQRGNLTDTVSNGGTETAQMKQNSNDGTTIQTTEGRVVSVRGAISCDLIYTTEEGYEGVMKLHSLTEGIDNPQLISGRMPEIIGECVVDSKYFSSDTVGKELTVSDKNEEDTLDLLTVNDLKVVGIVQSPLYLNFERGTTSLGNGKIDGFVFTLPESFQSDYYTELYVKLNQSREIYSDSYKELIAENETVMKTVLHKLALSRFDSITEDADQKLADAKQELADKKADGEKELADAKKELDDGKEELASAKQKIKDNTEKIEDAKVQIEEGRKEIRENEKKVADGLTQIADGQGQIADGLKQIEDALSRKPDLLKTHDDLVVKQEQVARVILDLEAKQSLLNQKKSELEAGKSQYAYGIGMISQKKNELEAGLNAGLITQDIYQASIQQIEVQEEALLEQGKQLEVLQKELERNETALSEGLLQAKSGQSQLISGMTQLNEALEQIKVAEEKQAELLKQKEELVQKEVELHNAEKEIKQAKNDLVDSEKEISENETKLADAKQEVVDAEQKLADGEQDYLEGKQEFESKIAEAEEKIKDAEEEVAELQAPNEYVLTREANVGYVCFENDSAIVDGIADIFPLFFFLVAALVCITTMNRMIDEQRTQIGILKALGYGEAKIMGNYLFYSGSAAITGCLIGFFAGCYVFPRVIWMTYGIMYGFAPIRFVFDPVLAVISLAVSMLCSMGTTWLSLRAELRSATAELIRPKAPSGGKRIIFERITFFWRRLSFLKKVSVRNLFRYKKRFFMMVIGISGCTALLVAGLGIKDSIADIAAMQFDGIQINDATCTLSDEPTENERSEFHESLSDYVTDDLLLMQSGVDMIDGDLSKSLYLMVPKNEQNFDKYFHLYEKKESELLDFPGNGEVIITQKFADKFALKKGDTVLLRTGDMEDMKVTISGVCKNYVYNYVYMSHDTYKELLGREPEYNTLLVNLKEGTDIYAAAAKMMEQFPVTGVSLKDEISIRFGKTLNSLNYIVLLVIACAASLAFIVLYNLTNININERVREIATIKVLGFYSNETAAYVFRENLVLTILGALTGLILGKYLHAFIINCIDIDLVYFDKIVTGWSYCLSFALTILFAVFIDLIMRNHLDKINMAESLKSIE